MQPVDAAVSTPSSNSTEATRASIRIAPGALAGAVAGVLFVAVPGLLVAALSVVPRLGEPALLIRLGPTEELTVKARAIRSFVAPWPVSFETTFQPGSVFERELDVTRLGFWGFLCLLLAAVPLGLLVRRWCGPSLRQRAIALAVSTGVVAALLAAVAVVGEHSTRFAPTFVEAGTSLDAGDLAARGALLSALVGFFAFGILSSLGRRVRAPLTRAVLTVGSLALLAALLFAVLLPLGRLPDEATTSRAEVAGSAAAYASGLGSAALPLLTGARAPLDVPRREGAPFVVGRTEGGPVYIWPDLARTLGRESPGRIRDYAATAWLEPVLVTLAIAFLVLWALSGIGPLRRAGTTSARDRLQASLIFGVSGAVLVAAIVIVGSTRVTLSSPAASDTQMWGKDAAFLLPTVLVLVALPLLAGSILVVAGALRGRRLEARAAPTPLPDGAQAVVGTAGYCPQCGAALTEGASFCGSCGRPRRPEGPIT